MKNQNLKRLIHYAHAPINNLQTLNERLKIKKYRASIGFKPIGLWVSVEGEYDWPSWCEAEEFDGEWEYEYLVELTKPENVLWLETSKQVLEFTFKYNKPTKLISDGIDLGIGQYIDWLRVYKDYSGLIISPYQWELRLDTRTFWYYGWDCASGCIWDKDIINLLELKIANEKKS